MGVEFRNTHLCSYIEEAVNAYSCTQNTHTNTHIRTHRYTHILRKPGGEAKGLESWAIKQLAAFLNLSILLSIRALLRIPYSTDPHSTLNIVSDRIVLCCAPPPILIVSPWPHTWSNWSEGSWFYWTSVLRVIGHLLLSPPWF